MFQPVFLTQPLDFRICCLSCACMPASTLTLKRIVAVGLCQSSSPNIMSWIPSISPLPPLSDGSCLISGGCQLSETSWKIVNCVWSYVLDILEKEKIQCLCQLLLAFISYYKLYLFFFYLQLHKSCLKIMCLN